MSFKVTYTSIFQKEAKRLAKKYPSLTGDILNLIAALQENPEQGTALGKGLYKIRIAIESKGRGKSGGARVITYVLLSDKIVYLVSIYDKSEQATINTAALVKMLKDQGLSLE